MGPFAATNYDRRKYPQVFATCVWNATQLIAGIVNIYEQENIFEDYICG